MLNVCVSIQPSIFIMFFLMLPEVKRFMSFRFHGEDERGIISWTRKRKFDELMFGRFVQVVFYYIRSTELADDDSDIHTCFLLFVAYFLALTYPLRRLKPSSEVPSPLRRFHALFGGLQLTKYLMHSRH